MIASILSGMFPSIRATHGPLDDFWYQPVGGESTAGIVVKPDNAMRVSAVFACIQKLAETLAQLDFRIFDVSGEKDVEAKDHELWDTLYSRPNSWQTPVEWQAMGMSHLCLRGNFYCEARIGRQNTLELIPLNPDRVAPDLRDDGRMWYEYHETNGNVRKFGPGQILHVRGYTMDGIKGVSVLEYARNAVGSAIAQETHGASLFKNGGLPTIWIGKPQGSKMNKTAMENFRVLWRKLHAGAENAGNPPILDDGGELHELGLTNRDSQWIEARGFQAVEICRFFGVPPYMIGVPGEPARNIEQMGTEFVRYTLAPWSARWCQAIGRDLIAEPEKYAAKQDLADLEKGDKLSRYQAHNIGIQGGWMLPNEARAEEGWEPIEGGDEPRFPMNMQPAGGGPDQQQQGGQPGKGNPAKGEPDQSSDDTAYQKRKRKESQKAFAVLVDEASARIAAAEIHGLSVRAEKAAEDREKWSGWAIEFYARHRQYIEKTLAPIADAWKLETGNEHNVSDWASRALSLVGPVLDVRVDVVSLLKQWNTTRPEQIADALKEALFHEKL
jgi:HK97 family phage portal protein